LGIPSTGTAKAAELINHKKNEVDGRKEEEKNVTDREEVKKKLESN
jgi:hypothetical protein